MPDSKSVLNFALSTLDPESGGLPRSAFEKLKPLLEASGPLGTYISETAVIKEVKPKAGNPYEVVTLPADAIRDFVVEIPTEGVWGYWELDTSEEIRKSPKKPKKPKATAEGTRLLLSDPKAPTELEDNDGFPMKLESVEVPLVAIAKALGNLGLVDVLKLFVNSTGDENDGQLSK